jgi:fatty acid desaturase
MYDGGRVSIWKHSWLDVFPFAITLGQLAIYFWVAATWHDRTAWELFALWPACVFLAWYNPIIATHNFIHTPYFRSDIMNRAYTAVNSITLVTPYTLYRFQHFNHHRHENDRRDTDGSTRDHSSTFAWGKDGNHENVVKYCVFQLFRRGTSGAFHTAARKGELRQFCVELVASLAGIAAMAILCWQAVICFFIPLAYLGWVLAALENYYEHYGANPEKRYANSVSYYSEIYNMLLCNEGYHQEHHLRPQAHWTHRPRVREEFREELDGSGRLVSRLPPVLAFLDTRRPSGA